MRLSTKFLSNRFVLQLHAVKVDLQNLKKISVLALTDKQSPRIDVTQN